MKKLRLKYWLRRIDVFGVPITFLGAHRLYYQTKLGGLLSILLIGYLLYLTVGLILANLSFKNLSVTTNIQFDDTPKPVILNDGNFIFAAKIQQDNYLAVHYKPFFILKLEFRLAHYSEKQLIRPISLIPCKIEQFRRLGFYNERMGSDLEALNYQDYLCSDLGADGLELLGRYNSIDFQYIRLTVEKCIENTNPGWNFICPTEQEVQNFVNVNQGQVSLSVLLSNININQGEVENMKGFIDTGFYLLSNPFKQRVEADLYLKASQVETNKAFFIHYNSAISSNTFVIHDQQDSVIRTLVRDASSEDTVYTKLYFRASQYSNQTNRQTQKLGTFLSYIGGLFNSIYVIIGFVMAHYSRYQLWLKLFKIHYTIILQSYQNHQRQKTQMRFNSIHQRGKEMIKSSYDSTKQHIENLVKDKYHQDNTLIPRMKYMLSLIICKKKQQIQGIGYLDALDVVQRDLNIVSYFQLQQDVQKLKLMLFNNQQLKIFELKQKQTIIMKDGHLKLNETVPNLENDKELKELKQMKRVSSIIKVGLDQSGQVDSSDLLDQHKKHLYGGGFQEKILREYYSVLEILNQLNSNKQQELKKKNRGEVIENYEQYVFEQFINQRIMNIFDEDIREIIKNDAQLSQFCFPSENLKLKSLNQKETLFLQEESDELKLIATYRQNSTEENLQQTDRSMIINVEQNLQEFLIASMQELNNFVFSRDLSRFLHLEQKEKRFNLELETIESLCKSTFFREGKIELFEGKIVFNFKSRIIKKQDYMPQLIEYRLTFQSNQNRQSTTLLKYRIKLGMKNIVQVNKMAKEEFLMFHKKSIETKYVTLELILSKSNSSYGKFSLVLFSLIADANSTSEKHKERNIQNLFEQLKDGAIKVSIKKEQDLSKKQKLLLSNSLANYIEVQTLDLSQKDKLYSSQLPFKSHLYKFFDECNERNCEHLVNSMTSLGQTITLYDLKQQKLRSAFFGKLNTLYDNLNMLQVCLLKVKFNPVSKCEIIIEFQSFSENRACLHLILTHPQNSSQFYDMLSHSEKFFSVRDETLQRTDSMDEVPEMTLIQMIEFISALFIQTIRIHE